MKKKTAAFVLALMLALSLGGTTALAAKKPTMKMLSVSSTTIKRGKTVKWKYRLNSNSYKKKSGAYRAMFGTFLRKGSAGGTIYADKLIYFSGAGVQGFSWKIPKTTPAGKYVNLYGTYYRKNASASWKCNTARTQTIKIKK